MHYEFTAQKEQKEGIKASRTVMSLPGEYDLRLREVAALERIAAALEAINARGDMEETVQIWGSDDVRD